MQGNPWAISPPVEIVCFLSPHTGSVMHPGVRVEMSVVKYGFVGEVLALSARIWVVV